MAYSRTSITPLSIHLPSPKITQYSFLTRKFVKLTMIWLKSVNNVDNLVNDCKVYLFMSVQHLSLRPII